MRLSGYVSALCGILLGAGVAMGEERPVLDDAGAASPWFGRLRNVAEDPAEHLQRARSLDDRGRLRRARRQYRLLVSRWPASREAAAAQARFAGLLHARGRTSAAFDAYKKLLTRYPHSVDYEDVVERLYGIALDTEDRRRMRFLFGGYRTPDVALPKLAWIVEHAPRSPRAVDAQMKIGRIHEANRAFDAAISAYTRVYQLFPRTDAAAEAIVRRAVCQDASALRKPNDTRRVDEAVFGLQHALTRVRDPEIQADLEARLAAGRERRAQHHFHRARFYDTTERMPQAAAVAYRSFLREFPDSEPWSGKARDRLQVIEAAGEGES